jgi:hypothetical protein
VPVRPTSAARRVVTDRAGPRTHLWAAVYFTTMAIALTWPIAAHLDTHLPGPTADDNVAGLWNFWWMRHALATGIGGFFHTDYLFYPGGVNLVLHTHLALQTFFGATIFGAWPFVTALNLTTIGSHAANGFAAYLLACSLTSHRAAAIAAGTCFMASPTLSGALYAGHVNVFSAWGLPLFAYAALRACDRGSIGYAVLGGATLAAIAYTDYYYLVYAGVLLAGLLLFRHVGASVRRSDHRHPHTAVDWLLLAMALAAATLALAIAVIGGTVVDVGSTRVSLTTGQNVRTMAWMAAIVWWWRRRRPVLTLRVVPGAWRPDARATLTMAAVCLALTVPLAVATVDVWRDGDYVTQRYTWRNAPAGVDLGSLVSGNPFHSVWGGAVRRWYEMTEMNLKPLWLGVAPVAVLWRTRRTWQHGAAARFWLLIAGGFFLWSLGPHLMVFGVRSGLPLPQILLRYVPVLANARIPSRATIMVVLASAMLLALAIAASRIGRSRLLFLGVMAGILVDFLPMPFPISPVDRPTVYAVLRSLEPGAVLEIPMGVRDGFGADGRIDPRTLYFQTIHQKPMVGGYVSRVPQAIKDRYRSSETLGTLLRLSGAQGPVPPASPDDGRRAGEYLRQQGVRYVVVDTEIALPEVRAYVEAMAVRLVASDGARLLYQFQ